MDLTFALQAGATVLREAYCEVPFKVTHVLNSHRPVAHLILMHSTAGLFGGDELECSIRVQQGARVLLTQQSATKIHPSGGHPAVQRTHITVETGAELQFYLDPVIPFAGSVFRQTTRIDIEPGARLAFWEGFTTGRIGLGESWKFQEFASETRLVSGARLVFLDRFRLISNSLEDVPWSMSGCRYAGTGLFVGERAETFAADLHRASPETGIDRVHDNVVINRVAVATGPEFYRCREVFVRQFISASSE